MPNRLLRYRRAREAGGDVAGIKDLAMKVLTMTKETRNVGSLT